MLLVFAISYYFLLFIPLLSSSSFSLLLHLQFIFVRFFRLMLPKQLQFIIAPFSFFIFWSISSICFPLLWIRLAI